MSCRCCLAQYKRIIQAAVLQGVLAFAQWRMRRVDSKVGCIRCTWNSVTFRCASSFLHTSITRYKLSSSCNGSALLGMALLSGLTFAVALQFPVGRTRLETVAVIVCAVIMSIATVLVIRESIGALVDGFAHRELPHPLHTLYCN